MKTRKYTVTLTLFTSATKTGKPTRWGSEVGATITLEAATKAAAEDEARRLAAAEQWDRFTLGWVSMMSVQFHASRCK